MTAARAESLGPAERIIAALLGATEHLVHHRPGIVAPDARFATGVRWTPATCREVDGKAVVLAPRERKKGAEPVVLGERRPDGTVVSPAGAVLGRWQPAGLFEPFAAWMYRQVAEVYRLDPEFVARWASWSFPREHRDLKVVLAAFLLVQPRSGRALLDALGKPVRGQDGKPVCMEEDDREVGEAMVLLRRADKHDLNPKLVLRVGEVLRLGAVAGINRELGFGGGGKHPFLGRYPRAVEAWLRSREANPAAMASLVKAGYRRTVCRLAQSVRYKPSSSAFFRVLRWKQAQHADGRRTVGIGEAVDAAADWSMLDERQVCTVISAERPPWKRLVGLVPAAVGLTPAVVAAAIEAGCLSDRDLVIATPTLEDLGLLGVESIRARWEAATRAAEDGRARNVAKNVQDAGAKAVLEAAADAAQAKVAEEATRGLRVDVCVDVSGSMHASIPVAKLLVGRLLAGMPLEKVRIAVFNNYARELAIPRAIGDVEGRLPAHAGKAVLDALFAPINAGGGTDYSTAVTVLSQGRGVTADEDTLVLFVGDEGEAGSTRLVAALRGVPSLVGVGLVKVPGDPGRVVQDAAASLGVPLLVLTPEMVPVDDPYAVPRVLRTMLLAAPRGPVRTEAPRRKGLVEEILETPRLRVPAWARAGGA